MDKSDVTFWMMMPLWMLLGFLMLFMIVAVIEGVDYLRKRPYKAQELYDARHVSGLNGLRGKERIQLFLNADALTVKPWFKPAIVIPWEQLTESGALWPFMLKPDESKSVQPNGMVGRTQQDRDIGELRKKVRFRRNKRYLLLYYRHEGKERIACVGFRYGDEEDADREAFYRCSESLEWYKERSRRTDPKDAVGTVNLRKTIKPRAERIIWRKDPETGRMSSEWEK